MAKKQQRAGKSAVRKSSSKKTAVTRLATKNTPVAKSGAAAAGKKSPSGKAGAGKSRKALLPESARPQRQDLGSVVKPPSSARGSFRWLAAAQAPVVEDLPVTGSIEDISPPPPAPPAAVVEPVVEAKSPAPIFEPPVAEVSPVPVEQPPESAPAAAVFESEPSTIPESAVSIPPVEPPEPPSPAPPAREELATTPPVCLARSNSDDAKLPPEIPDTLNAAPAVSESTKPPSGGSLIEREWRLANDRVGRALIVQAVLLVAFCVIPPQDTGGNGVYTKLLYVIPLVALAINFAGLAGLIALQVVIHKLKSEATPDNASAGGTADSVYPPGPVSAEGLIEKVRRIGYVPSLVIMAILAGVWFWLLGSIPG